MKKNLISSLVVLLALTTGCGGGSSSSEQSASNPPSGPSQPNDPTTPPSATGLTATVSLVDSVNHSLSDEVDVWMTMIPQTTTALTLASTSDAMLVESCININDPNQPPCLLDNGQIWMSCEFGAHQFDVTTKDDEMLQSFQVNCQESSVIEKISNRNMVLFYSVDTDHNQIVQHLMDPERLEMQIVNTFAVGSSPRKIAYHPSGNMIYVLNRNSQSISQLHISGINGRIEEVAAPVATAGVAMDILVHPGKKCAYVNNVLSNNSVQPYSISDSGFLQALAPVAFDRWSPPIAMALSDDGTAFYVSTGNNPEIIHYSVNALTCALTREDSIAVETPAASLTVNRQRNRLYATDPYSNIFVYFDLDRNGGLNHGANTLAGDLPATMECDLTGCHLADTAGLGQILLIQNTEDGDQTHVIDGGANLKALFVHHTGVFAYKLYTDNSAMDVYTVDNDCTLHYFFSQEYGGTGFGVIVNMIPLPQQDCSQGLYVPEVASRAEGRFWLGSLE